MLDHLIEPLRTPSDALHNSLILAITAQSEGEMRRAMFEAKKVATFVADETIAEIKSRIETLLTETADNAGA